MMYFVFQKFWVVLEKKREFLDSAGTENSEMKYPAGTKAQYL